VLRSVGDGDDTLEFPPVTVHETHVRSRTAADYIVVIAGVIASLWAVSSLTIVISIALVR